MFSLSTQSATGHIRQLIATDAPTYQSLRLEALSTNPESFLSTLAIEQNHQPIYFERELELARHQPMYGYYGIFVDDANLAGYLQIDTSYLAKQRHVAFLYNLYISNRYRRRGLAHQLCQAVFTLLRQHTQIELVFAACNAGNTSARAFYHQLGFRRCGIKPRAVKWQGQYDDEVELVLELKTLKPT